MPRPRPLLLTPLVLVLPACLQSGGGPASTETSEATASATADTADTDPTTGSPPACGDGMLDPGEQCDDANQTPGDGCENDCSTTPPPGVCGDGTLDLGEQCDDGNDTPGDDCENDCSKTPMCGNGMKEPGEDCDDGNPDNADACLDTCEVAGCGDGFVHAGVEMCDDGDMNGDYGFCDAECSGPGPRCGDGEINGPEECDDMNDVDDDECSNTCVAPRVVFVTSGTFTANLGGLSGADQKCAAAAAAANLGLGQALWRAWISDGTASPSTRFDTEFTGYYKLLDGTPIAHGWSGLTSKPLLSPIALTEELLAVDDPKASWTNTLPDGTAAPGPDCDMWSTSSFQKKGRWGDNTAVDANWTDYTVPADNPINCSAGFRLYCFQYSPAI